MIRKYGKPIRKCSIQELCTSGFIGQQCDRWCSDEAFIEHICELIRLEIFDLDDMKELLYYKDYCKIRKAFNEQKFTSEQN